MNALPVPPYYTRGTPEDLLALARVWEWERTVREQLPKVLANADISVVFQPIYQLGEGRARSRGYEALARFPVAPRIPTGLWFRVAREWGFAERLELTAARKAVDALVRLPVDSFLCINISPDLVPALLVDTPADALGRIVVEVSSSSLRNPDRRAALEEAHSLGVRTAIDDIPLGVLHTMRDELVEARPHMVKVDLSGGLAEDTMARFNIAEGRTWCREAGISLVALRVERNDDLGVLQDLGIEWAQGYSLGPPAPALGILNRLEGEERALGLPGRGPARR